MGKSKSKDQRDTSRLETIQKRQAKDAFGPDYQPAIRAVRGEAPTRSRAYRLWATKVGRAMHMLSSHELAAALIALYITICIDILEQKMLWVDEHTHPLFGYPGVDVARLPSVAGTVAVAEALGIMKFHPRMWLEDPESKSRAAIPTPLIGDLLLVLQDSKGIYCVDWMIKRSYAEFRFPPVGLTTPRNRELAIKRAVARTQLQIGYNATAEIRSQCIAHEPRLEEVVANLRVLHGYHILPAAVPALTRRYMLAVFQAGMEYGVPPLHDYPRLCARFICSWEVCQRVLYQAIWRRELRVDLYSAIYPDHPLQPETKDLLVDVYDWYRR